VEIQAHSKSGTATPWATVEAVLADIKTAVEQDHDLAGTLNHNGLERGTTRVVKREPGSTTVGTGVEYRLQYAESLGGAVKIDVTLDDRDVQLGIAAFKAKFPAAIRRAVERASVSAKAEMAKSISATRGSRRGT
jgi:hypothetical protein